MQLDSVGGPWEGSPRRSQGGPGGVREGPGGVPEGSRRGPGGVPGGARSTPEAQGGSEGDPEKNVRVRDRFGPDLGANLGGFGGLLGANLGYFWGIVFDIIFEHPSEPVWEAT